MAPEFLPDAFAGAWRARGAPETWSCLSAILRREFVGLLRSRMAFWIAVLTVGGTGLLPLVAWPPEGTILPYLTARNALAAYQAAAGVALLVFVPAVAAASIARERERATYDLLLATRIGPKAMVAAKLLASSLFFLLLIVLTFPTICVLYLLGGIPWWIFAAAFAAQGAFTLFLALVGVWASARNRKASRALFQAYGMFFALVFASAIFLVAGPLVLLIAVVLLAGFAVEQAARAEPGIPPELEVEPGTVPDLPTPPPPRTWLTRLVLAPCADGIPDRWSPTFAAALRSEAAGSAAARRSLCWATAVLLYLHFCVRVAKSPESAQDALAESRLLVLAVMAVALPALGVYSMLGERDEGRLDALRGSLLGPRSILAGKLLAALFGGAALPLIGLAAAALIFPFTMWPLSAGLPLLGLLPLDLAAGLAWAAAGLLAAALTPKTITALVLAIGLSLGSLAALPACGAHPVRTPGLETLFAAGWAALAAAEFGGAVAVFERRWMRDR